MIQFGQPKKVHRSPIVLLHRSSRLLGIPKRAKLADRISPKILAGKKNPQLTTLPRSIYWIEAGICYLLILVTLRYVHPRQLANLIISDSYLLLHLLFFFGNVSLLFALFQSWPLAILLSFGVETLLFFRLQQVQLEWGVILTLILPGLIFLGLSLYNNRRRAI